MYSNVAQDVVLTQDRILGADSAMLHRMWVDIGEVFESVIDLAEFPCHELTAAAGWIFDELVERGCGVAHYPGLEALLGICEIEDCDDVAEGE